MDCLRAIRQNDRVLGVHRNEPAGSSATPTNGEVGCYFKPRGVCLGSKHSAVSSCSYERTHRWSSCSMDGSFLFSSPGLCWTRSSLDAKEGDGNNVLAN